MIVVWWQMHLKIGFINIVLGLGKHLLLLVCFLTFSSKTVFSYQLPSNKPFQSIEFPKVINNISTISETDEKPNRQIDTFSDPNSENGSEPKLFPKLPASNVDPDSFLIYRNSQVKEASNLPLPGLKKHWAERQIPKRHFPMFDLNQDLIQPLSSEDGIIQASHNHEVKFGADGEIILVQGCSSCSKGLMGSGHGGSGSGSHLSNGPAFCGPDGCKGGQPCYPWEHNKTFVGRFAGAVYESLVCPDPCYEGKWIPLADSAFFSDTIRPVSQQKLRLESGWDMTNPTRNAYFWNAFPLCPLPPINSLYYNDLFLYTEIAAGGFSFMFDVSYRQLGIDPFGGDSGFGDMMVGSKSLLFDRELFQLSFEFKTFLPVGVSTKGLGTGHVSLEPTILACLKLKEQTYLQGQVSQWVPLGAVPPPTGTAGSLLHLHLSLNHVVHEINPDMPIVGTLEYTGYYFQAGGNQQLNIPSNLNTIPYSFSSGLSYQYLGPGIRLFAGNRYDAGIGSQIALSGDNHFASALIRAELRFRY